MKSPKHLYMAVTCDRLELPLCVADSAAKLASLLGISTNTVHSAVWKNRSSGKITKRKIVRVAYSEED